MQEQDIAPALFALAFVISFFGGIIGFIIPSLFRFGRPQRPSRKRIAAITLAACFASLIGLGATVPETPEQKARAEHAAKQRAEQAVKAKADEEAAAKAKVETAQAEVVRLWARITEEGNECDGGRKAAAAALEKGNRYRAYEKASAASAACRMANYTVAGLPLPSGLSSEQEDGLQKAVRTCATAYFMKKGALDAMLAVIDGDIRPSAVNAVKEASNLSDMAMMRCAAQYLAAGHAAGVPLERISAAGTKSTNE